MLLKGNWRAKPERREVEVSVGKRPEVWLK